MRKVLVALICLGIIVSWQIVSLDTANAFDENHKGRCNLAGEWITEGPAGSSISTIIPLDPAGKKFSINIEFFVPEDPTFYGYYPDATNITKLRGIAVKTSKNTYDYTLQQFAADADGAQQYDLILSGVTKLIDCDRRVNTFTVELVDHIYELPPLCFEPYTSQTVRNKMVPPCSDLLPFPDFQE